jgi:hypothetical protein
MRERFQGMEGGELPCLRIRSDPSAVRFDKIYFTFLNQKIMKLFSVNKFMAGALMLLLQVVGPHAASAQGCLVKDLTINTGYDPATGSPVSPGTQDPKWEVVALSPDMAVIAAPNVPNYNAFVVNPNSSWVTNPNSNWISFINNYTFATDGNLFYEGTFRRTFTTCKQDSIRFDINIANDNYCPGIRVDGMSVPLGSPFSQPASAATGNYTGFTTIPSFILGLAPGTHTIEVDVVNYAVWNSNNPYGLNIVGKISSATGIPSLVSEAKGCEDYVCSTCDADFNYCFSTQSPYQVNLTADDPTQPASYDWSVNGAYIGSGASFSYNFPGPGSYKVCLLIKNNKTGEDCEQCINICIADNGKPRQKATNVSGQVGAAKSNINVYPNPAGSTLYVEVKKDNEEDVRISLYDMSGKLVIDELKQSQKGIQKISVNTSKLVPGAYSIKVVSGTEVYQQTVVIKQ